MPIPPGLSFNLLSHPHEYTKTCENLQLPNPRLAMDRSPSWAFAYHDEANLTLAEINSSEERVASYNLTISNPTSSVDTLAGGWEFDATIDPALLTQQYVSSASSAYDASMQQP
jgi:hypothetical protein